MTREEAILLMKSAQLMLVNPTTNEPVSDLYEALEMAISALEQEPCTENIKGEYLNGKERNEAIEYIKTYRKLDENLHNTAKKGSVAYFATDKCLKYWDMAIQALSQEPKTGHCKECKYFEYDSVAKVDEIPLIVAHEICNKWGNGCKTKEDGYCYLYEPQESEDK